MLLSNIDGPLTRPCDHRHPFLPVCLFKGEDNPVPCLYIATVLPDIRPQALAAFIFLIVLGCIL